MRRTPLLTGWLGICTLLAMISATFLPTQNVDASPASSCVLTPTSANSCSYVSNGPGTFASTFYGWCVEVIREGTTQSKFCSDGLIFGKKFHYFGFISSIEGDIVNVIRTDAPVYSLQGPPVLLVGDRPRESSGPECMAGGSTATCSYTASGVGEYLASASVWCMTITRSGSIVHDQCYVGARNPTGEIPSQRGDVVTLHVYGSCSYFESICAAHGFVRGRDREG